MWLHHLLLPREYGHADPISEWERHACLSILMPQRVLHACMHAVCRLSCSNGSFLATKARSSPAPIVALRSATLILVNSSRSPLQGPGELRLPSWISSHRESSSLRLSPLLWPRVGHQHNDFSLMMLARAMERLFTGHSHKVLSPQKLWERVIACVAFITAMGTLLHGITAVAFPTMARALDIPYSFSFPCSILATDL